MRPRVLPSGERAVLLEFDDLEQVRAHYAGLVTSPHPDMVDIVPGARTILVATDPRGAARRPCGGTRQPARRGRRRRPRRGGAAGPLRRPDLAEVADLLDVSVRELVHRHTSETWTVAFCGFVPGFAYLSGERFSWPVPRRAEPRTSIPSGAVALAGGFTGVYPRPSPGGWQVLGRTGASLFDLDREPPALLTPGTRVRFRETPGGRS